ncbi:MAG TPA: glucose 1-dehydrogenase [Candidatus Binatia bacterium]|nr:glucose 1-dehydrogenase [Candidatus Binatia bacterium]
MILDRFRLDGKVAIVTGASAGIGRGSALAFADAGAHVVCAARTPERLEAVANEIRSRGTRALAVPCDVNDTKQIEHVVARTLEEFGRIDVVVNNAGGTAPTAALDLSVRDFEAAFHFNVSTAFLLTRLAAPHLAKHTGAVVNISSGLSHLVEIGFVAYGTAKAALSHMTRLLAHEFAPKIRVNALAVGATETDALSPFLNAADGLREQMIAMTPMARLGTPEDIACAVLYLASPAANWVTGKIFEVDGGTIASNWPFKMPTGL